ncbi:MAG: Exoglucanase B precursor [Bacteroidetes bacterium ADurb.Bin174]|nr:MAG: Exoglucanase B precursor [Bacteroidetes bacterium ADurb.Bin174]
MKKHIFCVLTGLFLSLSAFAQSFTVDGINYNVISDSSVEVTSGSYTGDIIIPYSVNNLGKEYTVTSIGNYAFDGCSSLTSITIPDGVTSIGGSAFYDCSSLTSITIPDGVTSIETFAFAECSGLTSISLPDGLTSIGEWAFHSSSLTSITLPDGVTSIGDHAFSDCKDLASITIPDGVTSIGGGAFYGCYGLTSITLPNGLTYIGGEAFRSSGINEITIPNTVTYIGDYAFYGVLISRISNEIPPRAFSNSFSDYVIVANTLLSNYKNDEVWKQFNVITERKVIVENLKEGSLALEIMNCGYGPLSSITHLTVSGVLNEVDIMAIKTNMNLIMDLDLSDAIISNNVLPDSSFLDKRLLLSIYLPKTLQVIGESAFLRCIYLRNAKIPSSVKLIKSKAFSECPNLSGELYLPEGLEKIDGDAFNGCRNLSGPLNIPSTVQHIGSYAFNYCINLTGKLILPDSLSLIGTGAFRSCYGLMGTLHTPKKIKNIPSECFGGTKIQQYIFHKDLETIGDFALSYLTNKIVLQTSIPPTGTSNTIIKGIPSGCHISIPKNSAMNYLSSTNWGSFLNVSEIQREYEVMKGESVFLYGTTPIYPVENIRYVWEPGAGLSDSTVAYPVFKADTSRQYKLTVYSNDDVYDVDSVFVQVYPMEIYNANDKELLCGQSVQLDSIQTNYQGEGPLRYKWTPATGLNCDTIPNPVCSSLESISYTLTVTTPNDHSASDTVHVSVYNLPPNPVHGFRVENIDFDKILLNWNKNDEADIAGYQVIRRSLVQAQDLEIVAMLDVDSIIDSLQIEEAREYSYLVYAIDLEGLKSDSVQVSILSGDATAPDTMRNLSAQGLPDQIVLSWNPNTEHDLWKYRIYRQNETDSLVLIAEVPLDTCSYTDKEVINEIVYRYAVTAVDKTDSTRWNPANESPFSELAVAKAVDIYPPAVPEHFTADLIDFKAVLLSWNKNPETDLKGYSLYRKAQEDTTSILLTATLTETSYVDTTGLNYQSCYEYFITATDTVGNESAFTSLSIKTGDAESPAVVSGLEALGMPDSIQISWTANTDADLAYYSIYRGTDSLSLTKLVDVESTMTFYMDKEVINEIIYYYAVTATDSTDNTQWNPANESPFSELAVAKAVDIYPPAVPEHFTADLIDFKAVLLSWNKNPETDLKGYSLYRKAQEDTTSILLTATLTETSYVDTTGLNYQSCYEYFIAATDTVGNESAFASLSIKTGDAESPAVVRGLEALGMPDSIQISWTANTEADLAYYSIYRGTDSLSLTKLVDLGSSVTIYTDKEVINEIIYYYAVTSIDSTDNSQWNPANESPFSELVQAFAPDVVPPAVPVLLEAQASNKRVELKWQAQSEPDLSLFRIYRSTDSFNFSLLDSVSGDTSLYTDTLVENFKSYYYCLSAVDTNRNESQASTVIKAEPFNLPPVITAFSDVVMHNQTEIMVPVYYDLSSSQDPDGQIVDYAWYINDMNVGSTPVLNTEIPQGTNRLKAVITDNDGAKDSVEFKVSIDGGYYTYESIEGQNAGITAIGMDLLFVPQAGGKMQVLNADLEPSFDVSITGEIKSVSSVSLDTMMYLSSSSKTIYCFNKRGVSMWYMLPLGGDLNSTPTIDMYRNKIYAGVSNNNLFALDRTTGTVSWSYRTTSPISQPGVIIGRDHLLIITDNGTAHIFDLTKTPTDQILSPVGTLNLNTTIRTAPAIDKDGFLYVSTTDGRLIKFYFDMNTYTGDILWNLPVGSSFETSPVIANNGNIYMGDTQGILYVMDNLSGQLLWQKDLGSAITSTITINEYGYYYVGTERGEMYAFIDRGQGFGEIIWHYASSSAISNATAFVNDCLLFSNRNGELFKIRENWIPTSTRAFPTEPQWGTYQGNYRRSGVQAETTGYTALPTVKTKPVVKQSPSPFSTDFQLEITLSATAPVNIQLMDIFGQIIHFEDLGVLNPGTHQRTIQTSNWPAGVYLYQVRIGDGVHSGKVMKR